MVGARGFEPPTPSLPDYEITITDRNKTERPCRYECLCFLDFLRFLWYVTHVG